MDVRVAGMMEREGGLMAERDSGLMAECDSGVGGSNIEVAYSGCKVCRHAWGSSGDGHPSQLLPDQESWKTGALFRSHCLA